MEGSTLLPGLPRIKLEQWTLRLCSEALATDSVGATEVIRALTGGHEAFCPQAHSSPRLHLAAAAFLRIARL